MAHQLVFQRYELKYMVTTEQKERILRAMAQYMEPDPYAYSTIRNIYLDTEDYRLIRRSIEKPIYKEKIRLRSYHSASGEDMVFVELKKKYEKVVYKRRIALPVETALGWVCKGRERPTDTQISREIDYFIHYYGPLQPSIFLSYEREAYRDIEQKGFRITFDRNILARTSDIALSYGIYGTPLLPEEESLMELKCTGGIPLWLVKVLSEEKIYKTSFSKYGTAYSREIIRQKQ